MHNDAKNMILKVFTDTSTEEKINNNKLLKKYQHLYFTLASFSTELSTIENYVIVLSSCELTTETVQDLRQLHNHKNKEIKLFGAFNSIDELREKFSTSVLHYSTEDFLVKIPHDSVSLAYNNPLRLQDIPKYAGSFTPAKYSHIWDALEITQLAYFAQDIPYDERDAVLEENGIVTFEVYDVDHQSDEYCLLQYIEMHSKPLAVVSKYADKTDFCIEYFCTEIRAEFKATLVKIAERHAESDDIISELETDTNSYSRSLVHEGSVYYSVKSPEWAYSYTKLPNPYVCITSESEDAPNGTELKQCTIIKTIGTKAPIQVEIEVDGTTMSVQSDDIFFKVQKTL